MPEDKARPSSISRRAVIGGAASAPTAAAFPAELRTRQTDDLVARCSSWLALDLEIDRLSRRWSELETQAVNDFDWFKLTFAQRRRLPMALEMDQIEDRLGELFNVRRDGLAALRKLKPADVHGVASKLVVAARVSLYESDELHGFIAEAVTALSALKCACCGAPYAPATPGRA